MLRLLSRRESLVEQGIQAHSFYLLLFPVCRLVSHRESLAEQGIQASLLSAVVPCMQAGEPQGEPGCAGYPGSLLSAVVPCVQNGEPQGEPG